jgi:hypothetical protein
MRGVFLQNQLHGLCERRLHFGERQLSALQLAADRLCNVQLERDLSDLCEWLCVERVDLRLVQCANDRLLGLQWDGHLHRLCKQQLQFGRRRLLPLQWTYDGLFDLFFQHGLPDLCFGVRPQRLNLRYVQFLHDWLCNLQLAFSLSDLH